MKSIRTKEEALDDLKRRLAEREVEAPVRNRRLSAREVGARVPSVSGA